MTELLCQTVLKPIKTNLIDVRLNNRSLDYMNHLFAG